MGSGAGRVGRGTARHAVPAKPHDAVFGNVQVQQLVEGAGRGEAGSADRDVERPEGRVNKAAFDLGRLGLRMSTCPSAGA